MISSFQNFFSFPLLAKDLTEQAQRKRTYLLRSFQAVILYCSLFFLLFDYFFRSNWNISTRLGHGKGFLEMMFSIIAWGIYLILPVMTAGTIAGERERDTWELLLVTRLGKRAILLEKYLGSLVAALSFLLLSIPVMIIIYPLGGIAPFQIIAAAWCLFLCILLVAATGLCCSAWSRTIAGALISTYLVVVGWVMIPVLTTIGIIGWNDYSRTPLHHLYEYWFPGTDELANIPWTLFWEFRNSRVPRFWGEMGTLLYYSVPTLIQVFIFLALAYKGISRPIRTGGISLKNRLFAWLDALFFRLNHNRLTHGKQFFSNSVNLPVDNPVAWRERNRALLSSPVHRIRIGVALTTILVLSFVYSFRAQSAFSLALVSTVLFILFILYFTISGAGLISQERSRQTLDVLLVSPIPGREILQQKMAGINRWYSYMLAGLGLIVALLCFLIFVLGSEGARLSRGEAEFLVQAFLLSIYFPPLAIWISVACGMLVKTQSRAVTTAILIVAGWSLLSWLVAATEIFTDAAQLLEIPSLLLFGTLSGPLFFLTTFLLGNQMRNLIDFHECVLYAIINAAFFLIFSQIIRRWCFRNFARRLGRLESEKLVDRTDGQPLPEAPA